MSNQLNSSQPNSPRTDSSRPAQENHSPIDRYTTAPSGQTLKRLRVSPDAGNQMQDLRKAGLDDDQQLRAMRYAIGSKADLARGYSHEFMAYLNALSYSVLGGWLKENAPEEVQDLFEDVIMLTGDVARFEGLDRLQDPYFSALAETVTRVSQLIPRLGGRFEEFSDY